MENEETFNFSVALAHLKEGKRVTRAGWNGKDMYIELQKPDQHSKMNRPYLFIRITTGELVPWVASNGDLLDTDWGIVTNSKG